MPTHDKVLFCLCFFAYGLLSNAGFTTALHPKNKHNRWWRPSAGERRVSVVVADNNCFSEMSNNNFDNNGIHHRYEDRRHGHQGLCMTIRCGGGANNQGTAKNHNNDDGHDAIATINVTNRISIIMSSIAKWYMNQLERHELRTKFMSSGILALVGDVAAQKFAHYMTTVNTISSSGLDKRRMMALFIDGMVITGPLLHYVYEFYERVLPTHDNSKSNSTNDKHHQSSAAAEANRQNKRFLIPALIHVLFDNFIMVSVYIAVLMVTTGLLEGRHYAFIPHELKHNLVPAILVSWRVSIMGFVPMQLLAFHYLPMKLRVLAVNVLDVIWVTVMSYVTHRNRH